MLINKLKKIMVAVLFSLISVTAFAQVQHPVQVVKNYSARLEQYKAEKKIIYYLATANELFDYVDCINEDTISESDKKAINDEIEKIEEIFDGYVELINDGEPGYETEDDFDLYNGWKKLYTEFEQYFSEYCAIELYAEKLEKGDVDYENQDIPYVTEVDFELGEWVEDFLSLLKEGPEDMFDSELEIFENWPLYSVQRVSPSNYLYNKTALVHIDSLEEQILPDKINFNAWYLGFDEYDFGYELYECDECPDYTMFSIVLAITDKSGNILFKGTEQIVGNEKEYVFSKVPEEVRKKIEANGVKLSLVNIYLNYGKINVKNLPYNDFSNNGQKIPLKFTKYTFDSGYNK